MGLLDTSTKKLIAMVIFGILYTQLSESDFWEQRFPEFFTVTKSYAQMTSGDVYGICAPIE